MARNSFRYLLITLLLVVCLLLLLLFLKREEPQRDRIADTAPFNYLPVSAQPQLIRHTHYTLSYAEEHEQAEWVAYELTGAEVQGTTERTDDFREDPQVTTGSASPDDYRRSGYDRGHLAPAADMGFSEQAMSESFYMSNISPQLPAFNRGVWKELEEETRRWAAANGSIYVVTGPVFGRKSKKIGENGVSVPAGFFKVILDYREPDVKAIAFFLPNKATQKPVSAFAVSVDEVETQTGMDFFPALPDPLEQEIEARFVLSSWFN